jgi:hypothetical protein
VTAWSAVVPEVVLFRTLAVCLFFATAVFAAEAPPLSLNVDESALTIGNVTTGGDVVVLAVAIESTGGLLREISGAMRRNDDNDDGTVTIAMGRRIPLRAIFVAVDVESGRYVIASPAGYDPAILPFPTSFTRKDAEGLLGVFDIDRTSAQMLIVQKKGGAWRLVATEGSSADADRTNNGKLSLGNADARPVGGGNAAAPKHLKNGDIIAVIDPGTMEVFVTEVGK